MVIKKPRDNMRKKLDVQLPAASTNHQDFGRTEITPCSLLGRGSNYVPESYTPSPCNVKPPAYTSRKFFMEQKESNAGKEEAVINAQEVAQPANILSVHEREKASKNVTTNNLMEQTVKEDAGKGTAINAQQVACPTNITPVHQREKVSISFSKNVATKKFVWMHKGC